MLDGDGVGGWLEWWVGCYDIGLCNVYWNGVLLVCVGFMIVRIIM